MERGGILGPLVGVAEAYYSGEAQGVAGGVVRRFGDLVGQDFEDDFWLDPHAGGDGRTDAGGTILRSKRGSAFADFAPLLVAEARADLGDRDELVGILVVHADQQGTHAELGTLAAAQEVAEHHAIDRVFEGTARVFFQLD